MIEPAKIMQVAKDHAWTMARWSFAIAMSASVIIVILVTGATPESHQWLGCIFTGALVASGVYAWIYYIHGMTSINLVFDVRHIVPDYDEDGKEKNTVPAAARIEPSKAFRSIMAAMPDKWRDQVKWLDLAVYVTGEDKAYLSRELLVPAYMPHFVYSRRSAEDETPTFPEVMVALGYARTTGSGYEWTGRARGAFKVIEQELRRVGHVTEDEFDDMAADSPPPRFLPVNRTRGNGRVVTSVTEA